MEAMLQGRASRVLEYDVDLIGWLHVAEDEQKNVQRLLRVSPHPTAMAGHRFPPGILPDLILNPNLASIVEAVRPS